MRLKLTAFISQGGLPADSICSFNKGNSMRRGIGGILLALVGMIGFGCDAQLDDCHGKSPPFWIGVPLDLQTVRPGETCDLVVMVVRSRSHKRDVQLTIQAEPGLEPLIPNLLLRADDSSLIHLAFHADLNSVAGDYTVLVSGSTTAGPTVHAVFQVRIGEGGKGRNRAIQDAPPGMLLSSFSVVRCTRQ